MRRQSRAFAISALLAMLVVPCVSARGEDVIHGNERATRTVSQATAHSYGLQTEPLDTVYYTDGDHVSISDGPIFPDITGHGWWVKVRGTGKLAIIKIWIQELDDRGIFRDVEGSMGQGTYLPGGGQGKTATARSTCLLSEEQNRFRSRITVDIVGEVDVPHNTVTAAVLLPCF